MAMYDEEKKNKRPQSYDTLKSYLGSIDVDTTNMDNDNIDLQYLERLKKRSGEGLSNAEKVKGGITLQQYIGDLQAQDVTNQRIAKAENQARQDTAYNSYVNSKLAKYLNIAEANSGVDGYTGITQGNRIQLANQERNVASDIQQTKQNAIQSYLQDYNNTLMQNSQYALDQETTRQATQDQVDATNYATLKEGVRNAINQIAEGKYATTTNNGVTTYNKDAKNEIIDYINNSKLTDEDKTTMINDIDKLYNWSTSKKDDPEDQQRRIQDSVIENKKVKTDGLGMDHINGWKTNGGNSIDETSGNGGRVYNFELDGQSKKIKATLDSSEKSLSRQLKDFAGGGQKTRDACARVSEFCTSENFKAGDYAKAELNGKKFIIYKRFEKADDSDNNGEFVIFMKGNSYNTKTDFDDLWNKIPTGDVSVKTK